MKKSLYIFILFFCPLIAMAEQNSSLYLYTTNSSHAASYGVDRGVNARVGQQPTLSPLNTVGGVPLAVPMYNDRSVTRGVKSPRNNDRGYMYSTPLVFDGSKYSSELTAIGEQSLTGTFTEEHQEPRGRRKIGEDDDDEEYGRTPIGSTPWLLMLLLIATFTLYRHHRRCHTNR